MFQPIVVMILFNAQLDQGHLMLGSFQVLLA